MVWSLFSRIFHAQIQTARIEGERYIKSQGLILFLEMLKRMRRVLLIQQASLITSSVLVASFFLLAVISIDRISELGYLPIDGLWVFACLSLLGSAAGLYWINSARIWLKWTGVTLGIAEVTRTHSVEKPLEPGRSSDMEALARQLERLVDERVETVVKELLQETQEAARKPSWESAAAPHPSTRRRSDFMTQP